MNNYKRLTNNNLEEYNPEYDFCMGCKYFGEPYGCNRPNGTCGNYDRFIEIYNRLADLEDKIENGKLIELPCKVGDTIWEVNPFDDIILSITVPNLHTIICWIKERAFGKYLFLSKSEAEAKLKELQGE